MQIARPSWICFGLGCALAVSEMALQAEVVVLPKGEKTVWRYLANGSAPGKAWTTSGFDDSSWKQGKAPLGYGEDALGATLSFGPDAEAKHITSYFRTSFAIDEKVKDKIAKLGILLRRDDGAIVYLNGKEVARSNMPAGRVSSTTLAATQLGGAEEQRFHHYLVPASLLAQEGVNTVAVEVHQASPGSSDLYLDLEIKGYFPGEGPKRDVYGEGMAAVARGDYQDAAELLAQLEPDHPEYAKTMAFLAHRIHGQALGRAIDGLPFAKKAYELEPQDRDVVRAYIKTHVLSGVLFDDKDIARPRKQTVAKEHAFLVSKPNYADESKRFSRAQLEADLNYLEHVLVKCFAYLELKDVDYRGALDAIRLSLDEETPVNSFELRIAKLISLFCDGHAGMHHDKSQFLPVGYAPYLAGEYKGRIYLYQTDGCGFLDPEYPYVAAVDGKPIDEWTEVAGYLAVKESRQWRRRQTLENLRYVNYLRAELGLSPKETIRLKLESEDGKRSKDRMVGLQSRLPRHLLFSRGTSRRLGDVGYLRIPRMTSNPLFLLELEAWMQKFRDTQGLIMDVRGNSGGTKDVLFTLFPYFMKPEAAMRIVELSAYRKPMELPKPHPAGFMMSAMSAQPVTSSRWKNDSEREQVAEFIKNFQPEWPLPKGKFSQWHVLALDAQTNPRAYYYDKPLIVLQDSGSFSAGDIFLGAFEDHPNTTLMGAPSGGGNGWMESYYLPNTGLGLVLCQSAKFRPNGKPYDGVGIPPDVALEATPRDIFGESDSVLDAAVQRLTGVSSSDQAPRKEPERKPAMRDTPQTPDRDPAQDDSEVDARFPPNLYSTAS